jgi:hypothetical protein
MNDIASLVAGVNKRLFVYETNLTTIDGNASESVRATYTVGAAAGAALAQRLLKNMTLKVDPQCIYSFNQYDIYSFGANGYVKLWGITRDLSPTLRLRPQGLAMAMINKVVGDSVYQVFPVDGETLDNLTIVAFRTDKRWNIAAVNPNPDAATVQVTFPEDDRGIPLKVYTLDYATSPLDTNEDDENVTIKVSTATPNNRTCTFVIPAWGFVVAEGAAPLPL